MNLFYSQLITVAYLWDYLAPPYVLKYLVFYAKHWTWTRNSDNFDPSLHQLQGLTAITDQAGKKYSVIFTKYKNLY